MVALMLAVGFANALAFRSPPSNSQLQHFSLHQKVARGVLALHLKPLRARNRGDSIATGRKCFKFECLTV